MGLLDFLNSKKHEEILLETEENLKESVSIINELLTTSKQLQLALETSNAKLLSCESESAIIKKSLDAEQLNSRTLQLELQNAKLEYYNLKQCYTKLQTG